MKKTLFQLLPVLLFVFTHTAQATDNLEVRCMVRQVSKSGQVVTTQDDIRLTLEMGSGQEKIIASLKGMTLKLDAPFTAGPVFINLTAETKSGTITASRNLNQARQNALALALKSNSGIQTDAICEFEMKL